MMVALLTGGVTAIVFAGAGWLGTIVSRKHYGALEQQADGPPPIAVPAWVIVAWAAAIGLAIGVEGESPLHVCVMAVAVFALTVCAVTDLRSGLIPDLFTLVPMLALLALAGIQHTWAPLAGAAVAFVPFATMALLSHGRGMGWGDVYLATLGGALAGIAGITAAVFLAAIAAFMVSVVSGRTRKPIAFGPYLAASIGVSLVLVKPF